LEFSFVSFIKRDLLIYYKSILQNLHQNWTLKALKNLKQEKLIRQKDVAIKILKTVKNQMES
jgi:hypothetical protein